GLPARRVAGLASELLARGERTRRLLAVDRLAGGRVDALETDRRVGREVHEPLDARVLVDQVEQVLHVARDQDAERVVRRQAELVMEVETALPGLLQVVAVQDAALVGVEADRAEEGRELRRVERSDARGAARIGRRRRSG